MEYKQNLQGVTFGYGPVGGLQSWVSPSALPYCLRFAAWTVDMMVITTADILDHPENGSHKLMMADGC